MKLRSTSSLSFKGLLVVSFILILIVANFGLLFAGTWTKYKSDCVFTILNAAPLTQKSASANPEPVSKSSAVSLPLDWLDCKGLLKLKGGEKTEFYRQGYKFWVYDFNGKKKHVLVKGLRIRNYDTYKVSKYKRSVETYLQLTNNGQLKHPGVPRFYGGCSEGPWWGMAMEFKDNTEVLCLDKKPFGDSKRCADNPNTVMALAEKYGENFIVRMTKSVISLIDFLLRQKAFVEDFTATNFVIANDSSGQVSVVDFDALMFQDNDHGFLHGTRCLNHDECPYHPGWMLTHDFAKHTLGNCMDRQGFCNNETRVCQGFNANLMLCGFSHWIFKRMIPKMGKCAAYSKVATCTMNPDPTKRCSTKEALSILQECENIDWEAALEQTNHYADLKASPIVVNKKDNGIPHTDVGVDLEVNGAEDAVNAAILKGEVPNVGYQPYRNHPRWDNMVAFMKKHGVTPSTAIDYGSNTGFFSMKLAKEFGTQVFSIDSNDYYKCEYPMSNHLLYSKRLQINNLQTYCKGRWSRNHIIKWYETGKSVDVQVVLSIFHWLRIKTTKSAYQILTKMFLNSRITFLELPQPKSKYMNRMKKWVGDQNTVRELIADVVKEMQANGHNVKSEFLVQTVITDNNSHSNRELIGVVADISQKDVLRKQELFTIHDCKQLPDTAPPIPDGQKCSKTYH